jgi:hypothetical protein
VEGPLPGDLVGGVVHLGNRQLFDHFLLFIKRLAHQPQADALGVPQTTPDFQFSFEILVTTGKSFLNMANALKANGAIEVVGLFLGKTHWKDDLEDFKKLIISNFGG